MRLIEIESNAIVDLATERGRQNVKAMGYNTAVAKQTPLRTLQQGPDGLEMRNTHDILADLTLRAIGNSSGDRIKADPKDAHLINILLELGDITKKLMAIAFFPTSEQKEEIKSVLRPRIEAIVAEVEAADETGQRK